MNKNRYIPAITLTESPYNALDSTKIISGLKPRELSQILIENIQIKRKSKETEIDHEYEYFISLSNIELLKIINNYADKENWKYNEKELCWISYLDKLFTLRLNNKDSFFKDWLFDYNDIELPFNHPTVIKKLFNILDHELNDKREKSNEQNNKSIVHLSRLLGNAICKQPSLLPEISIWWQKIYEYTKNIKKLNEYQLKELIGKNGHSSPNINGRGIDRIYKKERYGVFESFAMGIVENNIQHWLNFNKLFYATGDGFSKKNVELLLTNKNLLIKHLNEYKGNSNIIYKIVQNFEISNQITDILSKCESHVQINFYKEPLKSYSYKAYINHYLKYENLEKMSSDFKSEFKKLITREPSSFYDFVNRIEDHENEDSINKDKILNVLSIFYDSNLISNLKLLDLNYEDMYLQLKANSHESVIILNNEISQLF